MITKKSQKVSAKDYLEKHQFSVIDFTFETVLKTNLDLDELVMMLEDMHEDDLDATQVINQTTGEIYTVELEKQIKLKTVERNRTCQAN